MGGESTISIPESFSLSGYLYKKSTSGEWQKRFFEVNGSYLTYYKTDKMTKLLAAINIPQVGKIQYTGEVHDSLGTGHVFQMDLKDRQYFLRCETFHEAKRWVDTLVTLRDTASMALQSTNPLSPVYSPPGIATAKSVSLEPKAVVQKSNRSIFGCCCTR
jgi:hypothetical protein